jgi:hypothetical protein
MSEESGRLQADVMDYDDNFTGIVVKLKPLLSDRWESIGMVWKSDQ